MSAPAWLPNHAYLLTALVTPTNPSSGYVWWVIVPGTSGGAEPTWPTTEPWLVVDGGVTWSKASSGRQQMVKGLYALLSNFLTANPTMLAQVSASRPKSLTNVAMPFAYIGDRDESINSMAHLMTRTFSGLGIVVCDVTPDNAEAEARMDALVDGLETMVAKYYHAASPNSITQLNAVTGFQPPEEGLYCQFINIGDAFVTEGTD